MARVQLVFACLTIPWICAADAIPGGAGAQPTASYSANLVSNGGFESPTVSSADYFLYAPGDSIGRWVVEQGMVDLIAGGFWSAPEGLQSLDLDGSCGAGTIRQDVPSRPSQVYMLRFALAGNPDGLPKTKLLQVLWNGSVLDVLAFDTTGHTRSSMGYVRYEYMVAATGPVSRIEFRSLTPGCYGPVLDAIELTPLSI